LEWMR